MTAAILITIRIPPVMLAEIDATAVELGMNRSDLVRARLRWAATVERLAEPEPLPMAAE